MSCGGGNRSRTGKMALEPGPMDSEAFTKMHTGSLSQKISNFTTNVILFSGLESCNILTVQKYWYCGHLYPLLLKIHSTCLSQHLQLPTNFFMLFSTSKALWGRAFSLLVTVPRHNGQCLPPSLVAIKKHFLQNLNQNIKQKIAFVCLSKIAILILLLIQPLLTPSLL